MVEVGVGGLDRSGDTQRQLMTASLARAGCARTCTYKHSHAHTHTFAHACVHGVHLVYHEGART